MDKNYWPGAVSIGSVLDVCTETFLLLDNVNSIPCLFYVDS